jgi:hypothetical protein
MVFVPHPGAAPGGTAYHASRRASGMAGADIGSIAACKYVNLVAVADVDPRNTAPIKIPRWDVRVYEDWG